MALDLETPTVDAPPRLSWPVPILPELPSPPEVAPTPPAVIDLNALPATTYWVRRRRAQALLAAAES